MDIKKLEEVYPFLNNIVLAYKKYDEPVDKENDLYSFYDKDVTYYAGDKNKCTHISVKLLRNLRTLLGDTYKRLEKYEYCIYLYHWIYYRTKESGISNILLSTVYTEFENKKHNEIKNICPYNTYKIISKESDEIIKLNMFYNNMESIRDILIKEDQSNNCKLQEFIYTCVNIYKDMNKKYCQTEREKNITNKDICDIVKIFHTGYTSYILNKKKDIKIDVPSSDYINDKSNTKPTYVVGCSSHGNQEESNSNNNDQPDSTVLHNVPKILGTLAGISSFMAISYKFTPFRKFLQLRRGAASLSNSLNENEPTNLINNESDPWNGSTNNTKYNIGYGSV
ncbi:unnamed protein product [Plasmodium vivax]|uniref:(malaria parasite P. vivax) hypothetical protein n=1 Tax=Plasmodium vivax TaxID=5855 RepID=A0A8S4H946_PLAVI|nr:unnamed protein product [Plasmodium vivax]